MSHVACGRTRSHFGDGMEMWYEVQRIIHSIGLKKYFSFIVFLFFLMMACCTNYLNFSSCEFLFKQLLLLIGKLMSLEGGGKGCGGGRGAGISEM